MAPSTFRIKLNGKVFTQTTYFQQPETLTGLMQYSYSRGMRALCLCSENCPELYIAYRNGHFYLAKMPETGQYHHPVCEFYQLPESDSGRSGYAKGAIIDRDGELDVSVGVPLRIERQRDAQPEQQENHKQKRPGTKRSSIELLGMLHLLWEFSNNARWYPKIKGVNNHTRTWGTTYFHIQRLLPKIAMKGRPLQEQLYVVPPFQREKQEQINEAFSHFINPVIQSGSIKAQQNKDPMICKVIVGEVKELIQSKYGYSLKLKGFNLPIYISKAKNEQLLKSYPLAYNAMTSDTALAIAIIVVAATTSGNLTAEYAAMMPVSKHYIPFDSSFELTVGNLLIEQERAFEKPMRYDNEALTLPDFILCDAQAYPRIPMEIYGMTGNDDYDQRKKEKKQIYSQTGNPYWAWEPAIQIAPPSFPEKRPSRTEVI